MSNHQWFDAMAILTSVVRSNPIKIITQGLSLYAELKTPVCYLPVHVFSTAVPVPLAARIHGSIELTCQAVKGPEVGIDDTEAWAVVVVLQDIPESMGLLERTASNLLPI